VPVPGETALISAGVLAATGRFDIVLVIVVAATAAIIGDNIGYWLGRIGGRKLLMRWGFIARHAERALPAGERFFAKHGGKTVFFARFIFGLRVFGAWIAGMTKMKWLRFLFWNAVGGICWATGVGLGAYYLGKATIDLVARWGAIGALGIALLALAGFAVWRWRKRST
jgi:membrane protein DedA with SNARE-associated domain